MISRLSKLFWAVVLVLFLLALVLPFAVAFLAMFVLGAVVFFTAMFFLKIGKGR